MTNDTPTLQLAVWDDPLAANGLQTDTDDALITIFRRSSARPRASCCIVCLDA